MTLFGEAIDEKIKEFVSKEGPDLLKAAGIGLLYYGIRKLGGDFTPGRGISLNFDRNKGVKLGNFSVGGDQTSVSTAVKALYSAGYESWSDNSKVEYAKKIIDVLDNALQVSDDDRNTAIQCLEKLSNGCWSSVSKAKITDYIVQVTEM